MPGTRGNDDHVRALLDQRAQRADVPPPPTRFSIFSDRSDSPSLYSHFDNNYRNAPSTPVPRFPRFHDSDDFNDRHDLYPPLSPKERLADPNASSLDLSEDTDTFSESESTPNAVQEDDSNLVPEEDEDPETRLSLMGPKMRVHSRAPWEEGEDSLSEGDSDDGGNDNNSIFGGKKTGLMRGLGFGSRSPAPRPSFDSSLPNKGKRSFDTTSSAAANINARSAIQALAQASMSSTSLAIGPAQSLSRFPHKLSMGRLVLSDRSASGPASASDTGSNYPPLGSPRSAVYTERSSGRDSPASRSQRRDSISPSRQGYASSIVRTRSPSPNPPSDRDSVYTHPYANPALLSAYRNGPTRGNFTREDPEDGGGHSIVPRNESMATLAASEETVTMTHSSSFASASVTSTSGMETSTPPTSDYSLVSSVSKTELFKPEESAHESDKLKQQQKRSKRETRLGPISPPSLIANSAFSSGAPYNLISLEQAQARVRERNRSATTGAMPFPPNSLDENGQDGFTQRARSTSAAGRPKHLAPLFTVDSNRISADDTPSPISSVANKHPNPGGRVLRPKRSGFMKLFNGREKDKQQEVPPPLPATGTRSLSHSEYDSTPSTARPAKVSTHRVPVPAVTPFSYVGENRDDSRSKKTGPSLSIKVSPPNSRITGQEMSARRSDSPHALHPPMSPKMPTSAPADMTQFPALKLRPVSAFFSKNFGEHLLAEENRPESPRHADVSSLISPTTAASSDLIPSPVNAGFNISGIDTSATGEHEDQAAIIAALKDQIRASRITWQRQIWELEGQIHDLRAELDDLKSGDVCEACGRGGPRLHEKRSANAGVIHRPRAKTGHGARFASGNEG